MSQGINETNNSQKAFGFVLCDVTDNALNQFLADNPGIVQAGTSQQKIILTDTLDRQQLVLWLEGPHQGVIQLSGQVPDNWSAVLDRVNPDRSFFFSATTEAAYKLDLGLCLARVLVDRLGLTEDHVHDISTVLQEAISNALLHGNLELKGGRSITSTALQDLDQDIDDQLANPDLAGRHVQIVVSWDEDNITVRIVDQGKGFRQDTVPDNTFKGRGLALMEKMSSDLSYEDEGRCLVVVFTRHQEATVSNPSYIRRSGKSELHDELVSSRLESHIVVVEDDTIAQIMIKGFLEQAGYRSLHFAADGAAGLEMIRNIRPSLVILDVNMPVMNGYEVLRQLREDPDFKTLPVIVETAMDSPEERAAAFDHGATDLVAKPLNGSELNARIRIHLENSLFTKALEAYRQRIEKDLATARHMQSELTPPRSYLDHVEKKYAVTAELIYEPSLELGGDYLGLECIDDHRFAFFLADFTGHGVASALNTFRLQSVLVGLEARQQTTVGYLEKVNSSLCRVLPRGQFATALCGIMDFENNILTYAGAGGTPLFIRHPGQVDFEMLEAPGLPLGISEKASYMEEECPFAEGAELFLCSDALIESPNAKGETLEEKGVLQLLTRVAGKGDGEKPLARLDHWFRQYASQPLSDDLSLFWLRRCSKDNDP